MNCIELSIKMECTNGQSDVPVGSETPKTLGFFSFFQPRKGLEKGRSRSMELSGLAQRSSWRDRTGGRRATSLCDERDGAGIATRSQDPPQLGRSQAALGADFGFTVQH